MIDARQHVIGKLIPFDHKSITIDATSGGVGLTSAKLNANPKPKQVIITVETARFRYTIDGTAPTASIGHLISPNASLVLEGFSQLNNFRGFRTTSTSAKIHVTYLR